MNPLFFSKIRNCMNVIRKRFIERNKVIPSKQRNVPDISVNEILGRKSIALNLSEISGFIKDKVILITGAGGSIGSELCRQISVMGPKKLILLGHGENSIFNIQNELMVKHPKLPIEAVIADIQDKKRLEDVFSYYRPQIIFHAAAHKHVPLMEINPSEAVKNNVFGTRNVAICALNFQAECFVFISSDKAVNSSSVMGATKRLAELMLYCIGKSTETRFLIVRFGNVLGSRGSVLPLFQQQIKEGGPVTVTHPDMVRYFMTIPEAVQLVFQAGSMAKGGEIFVLDMGKPVKILDLAHQLIRLSGFKPNEDIKIVFTGIRPGEKLVEEIFTDEEKVKATKCDFIYICEPAQFSGKQVNEALLKLEQIVYKKETFAASEEIRSVIRDMIPGFPDRI